MRNRISLTSEEVRLLMYQQITKLFCKLAPDEYEQKWRVGDMIYTSIEAADQAAMARNDGTIPTALPRSAKIDIQPSCTFPALEIYVEEIWTQ